MQDYERVKYRFSDARFQQLAADQAALEREYGRRVARNLYRRLNIIINAADSRDLFEAPGRFHPLTGRRSGDFAFDLSGNIRLIVQFEDDRQTAVIVGIEDYH